MKTYIVYFDESGDDGNTISSSDHFVLTSLYMPAEKWQENYDLIKKLRKSLRDEFGFHISEEMHTKHFLSDKNPYRKYNWDTETRQKILIGYSKAIASLDAKIINVIIDKTKIKREGYEVLENALKYNIQRIENDSNGEWNYIIITDKGRIVPMRKTARAIRAYNPIHSKYSNNILNKPITCLIEDIMEKDSQESYFIQICDFVSFFVHLYFVLYYKNGELPNRIGRLIDRDFVGRVMATLRESEILNLQASRDNKYGLVIYPK